MQIGTAPILLRAIGIDLFSTYIIAISISSYLSLLLNGYFYSVMNNITKNYHLGRREESRIEYSKSIVVVLIIFAVSFLMAVVASVLHGTGAMSASIAACALAMINFSYVLVDANFRARDRFALGTNIMSVSRIIDWTVLIGFLILTHNVGFAFELTAVFRLVSFCISVLVLNKRHPAMSFIFQSLSLGEIGRQFWLARGQMNMAFTTAAITIGPQLIVSSVFSPTIAVSFNVTRTYMRLLTVGVNTVTAASWPLINKWHALSDYDALAAFLKKGVIYNSLLGLGLISLLIVISPITLPILYGSKITIDLPDLILIGVAVLAVAHTTFVVSYYVSTNENHKALITLPLILLVEYVGLWFGAIHMTYQSVLLVMALVDVLIATTAYYILSFSLWRLRHA